VYPQYYRNPYIQGIKVLEAYCDTDIIEDIKWQKERGKVGVGGDIFSGYIA
jgi:hypothetical protein